MAEQLGEAVLTFRADTQPLEAGLQRAQQQAQQFGRESAAAFIQSNGSINASAQSISALQARLGLLRNAYSSVEIGSAQFGILQAEIRKTEQELATVGVTAGEAAGGIKGLIVALGGLELGRRALGYIADQLKELDSGQAAVRTLGVNSAELTKNLQTLSQELNASISVNDLLKASYDVLSSGFTTSADATNILRASALGAQGGFAELNDVVQAVTGVINAYGLSSADATRIVDGFLQTQNDGVITVRQYAAEIGNIASIAAAGGVGLNELNAAIATATLRGVPVAQTFTGLRQALSSIIKPSQQAAELAANLGLQFNVSALQSKGLAGVLADVQKKTGGSAEKIAVLLGSVEAQAAVQPLLNDSLAKYNELLARQSQSEGAAAKASETNANTITGNIGRIQNSLSNLAITLDSTLNPVFGTLATNISNVLGQLTKVLNLVPKGAGTVNGAIAASLVFGPAVGFQVLQGAFGNEGTNSEPAPQPEAAKPKPAPKPKPDSSTTTLTPAQTEFIKKSSELEIRGLQERLEITRQLVALSEPQRVALQNRLALNEKLRNVQQTQLDLDLELAKPKGSTGSPAEQDPEKVPKLQNKLSAGQVEVATLRLKNQQADAEALRNQQDLIRGSQLEAANARAKLSATQQQTQLERQALAAGVEVSRTAQLRLQQEEAIAAAKRQQASAQQALRVEQAKPEAQQNLVVIDELGKRLNRANEGVRQAYANAGLSLVQNARTAAQALKSAQQSFNSTARGGFQFLTPQLQQEQMRNARASVQTAVDKGLIRTGIDISSPEKLFQVAAFAEQIVPAQKALENALAENTKATQALTDKDWNVYLGGKPVLTPKVPTVSQEPVTFTMRNPAAGAYGVFGGF